MNNATYPEYTIHTAYALFGELTGMKIKEPSFREFANIAMNQIKFNVMPVKVSATVSEDGTVYLPCEAKTIISVAVSESIYHTWEYAGLGEGGLVFNRMGDRATDVSPSLTDDMNTYINYTFMPPNRIKVDDAMKGENIYVAAKAKLTDEEGGPLINMKQVLGVVWYVAYLKVQRDAFAGIQGMDLRYVRDKALTAVADAKVPENISNNEWNQIMDAKVSFGRKTFNKDFKF